MYITVTESLPGEGNTGEYFRTFGRYTFVRSTKVRRDKMPRAGGDSRGSSRNRLRRKLWLLSPEASAEINGEIVYFGGDGETVPCWLGCGRVLTFATVESDRIVPGGPYRRGNVAPACRPCNLARSDDGELAQQEVAARVAATVARTGRLTPALAV